jgi:hypothetical protein
VLLDESIQTYHADEVYLGSTQIKWAGHSFALFHERVVLGNSPASDSDALAQGRVWHTLREIGVDRFYERAKIVPPDFTTQGGGFSTRKEAKAWLAEQGPDAICLTQDQSDSLGRMQDQFDRNTEASELEAAVVHREPSIRWESTAGVKVRCRPDAICEGGILVDYKSTREKYPLETFRFAVRDYGYGISDALYSQGCLVAGLADPPMVFVATSTVEPFETQVLTLPESYREWCQRRLEELLIEISVRRATGDWLPVGYGRRNVISMPGFGVGNSGSFVE